MRGGLTLRRQTASFIGARSQSFGTSELSPPGRVGARSGGDSYADLDPPPFGWPELDEVRRHPPTTHLDGAAWASLWQAELASPGALHRWHLGRVHALVLLMEGGWEPEPIEVVGRVIVDGNHRAAAARALGRAISVA